LIRTGDILAERYELGERIGRGGFATVFRAKDRLFGREVAVKIVELDDTPTEKLSDLLSEARFVAAQRHPNILDVYDFGQTEDVAYLVMPLATGGTLAGHLRQRGRLTTEETGHFLGQIATGLDHAHSLGVAHRDIKPQNILLFEPSPYHLAISDFGLAKIIQQTASGRSSTLVSGTPSYMSPEQIQGKPTQATDIYALGVLLYQMLTGDVPYKGEPTAVMYAHLHEPVPTVHITNPNLPPALSQVVARAMAKNPAERPARAIDIYNDFRHALGMGQNEATTPLYNLPPTKIIGNGVSETEIAVPETPKKKPRFQFKFSINIAISIGALILCVVGALLVLNTQNRDGGSSAIAPGSGAAPRPTATVGISTEVGSGATAPTRPPVTPGSGQSGGAPVPTSVNGNTQPRPTVPPAQSISTLPPRATTAAATQPPVPAQPAPTLGERPPTVAAAVTQPPQPAPVAPTVPSAAEKTEIQRQLDDAWQSYKREFIQSDGRVIDPIGSVTTSEGQSYAMLRAAWQNDRQIFDLTLKWAQDNLNVGRGDKLFAFKWGQAPDGSWRVLDAANATDADIDIALALVFGAKRWNEPRYETLAKEIIASIWDKTVVTIGGKPYLTAGDWAARQSAPTLNVSYFAPYAFRVFATLDPQHDWKGVIDTSYEAIRACSTEELGGVKGAKLPANWCAIDKQTGKYSAAADPKLTTEYGYDAFRTMWRVALDYRWYGERRALDYLQFSDTLRRKWASEGKLAAVYTYDGKTSVDREDLAIYGGNLANFVVTEPTAARQIFQRNFQPQFFKEPRNGYDAAGWQALNNYYTQNWAWFGLAFYADLLPNLAK
jgi:endoglucanase